MNAAQFDALLQAAPDGIDHDGLRVVHEDDGYRIETPDARAEGLAESELHRIAEVSPYVSNWYFYTRAVPDDPAARTLLRHLERADERPVVERYEALEDGVVTEWRDFRVEATVDAHGFRRYSLEHATDVDDPVERARADALRNAVARDDDTVPADLRAGWRLTDCDHEELLGAVESVAPGSVAEWYEATQEATRTSD